MIHNIEPLLKGPKLTPEEEERIYKELMQKPSISATPSKIITLDNLIIEEKSPRGGKDKKLFTYDKSLEVLRQRNYQRHLRPDEAFRLLIDTLENPNSKYKQVSEDMLLSYGEWLSSAMLRKSKDKLTCYTDPENLIWDSSQYKVQGNLKYSQEKTFTIDKDIPSQSWVDLNKFPNDLVEFLYSRPFDKLPKVMQKGNKRAQLWLPEEGIIRPVGRGYDYYDFCVDACYDGGGGASRGVRERR